MTEDQQKKPVRGKRSRTFVGVFEKLAIAFVGGLLLVVLIYLGRWVMLTLEHRTLMDVITGLAVRLSVIGGFFLGVYLIVKGLNALERKLLDRYKERRREAVHRAKTKTDDPEGAKEFVAKHSPLAHREIIVLGMRLLKVIVLLKFVALYVPYSMTLFPGIAPLGTALTQYLFDPLAALWGAFIDYIPELVYIVILLWVAAQTVKLLRFVAVEISEERLKLEWISSDSALPMFTLLKLGIWILALIAIFPKLPGAETAEFKAIAAGIAFFASLGSTSALGNSMAGLILSFMRPFQIGDMVKVEGYTGKVSARSVFSTRITTLKNEEINVPNLKILQNETINYSTQAKEKGLIIYTTVSIGYDVPWRQVNQLLLAAAQKTKGLLRKPAPFVRQKSLEDYYVVYEINSYTKDAGKMAATLSALRSSILDEFAEAGVEILSPAYTSLRDGHELTVPQKEGVEDNKGFRIRNMLNRLQDVKGLRGEETV